jgi:hypothetical protein
MTHPTQFPSAGRAAGRARISAGSTADLASAAALVAHGSLATMLARSAARHHGHDMGLVSDLGSAWRSAAIATVAAVGALALFR